MKLSIGQFVALIVVLAAIWFFYDLWWSKQNNTDWLNRFHKTVYDNDGELEKDKEKFENKHTSDGWIK